MWIIRKCFPVFIGLISLLLLNKPVNVQASHAQGLDLTYVCLGGNEYRFTLNLYRDCSGIIVSNATTIFLSSVSCGVSFSTPLSLISGPVEVSPLCVAQLGQSTCASLPPCTMPCLPGVEQYTYQGTFTFTQNCTDWIVSFEECCRNVAITNLAAPASQSLFVSASLNNAGGLCNNSPIFTSSPVPYICANQLFCYNHGAYDADGDSLVYSLVAPLDGPAPGTPISYSSGLLSPGYPLHDTRGMIDFDPLTGSMCVNPTVTLPGQVAVIAVEVAEYRSGVRIGTIIRDIQMVVLQCGNNQPRQNPQDISNVVNAVRTDSNSVEACPGVPLSFAVMFDDIDLGDVISVNSNIALVCAGANMTTVGTNPVVATFSWLPAANQTGYYNFTVTIQDDGCPILGTQIFNFDILVSPGTSAGPDVSYCPGGSPVPLLARGGTNFNWSVITGGPGNLTCTNCANPRATPGDSVLLEVISNLSPGCKNRDTIRVNVVPSFLLDAGSDTTICRYGLAQFNALATPAGPGFSPYTYVWSPADSLSNVNTANAAANPLDSTRYYLAVTAANGCTITDSVDVNINGIAPRILAKPVDTICENAPLALLTTVFQDCGPTSNACSGPLSTANLGTGAMSLRDYGPWMLDPGFQYSNVKQYLFRANELNALGFAGGGKITALGLYVVSAGDIVNGVEVRMACVPDSAFLNSNLYNGLTVVKSLFNWNPVVGLNTINLNTPYMWDGQSSLLVEFCTNTQQNFGMASTVQYDFYSANVTCYVNDAFAPGACGQATGILTTARPRMAFTLCQALPPTLTYSWNPPTFLNNSGIAAPTTSPSVNITYTVSVSDGTCTGSDEVSVTVSPVFSIDAGADSTLCRNESLQLNASLDPGSYTFSWSPTTGLSNPFVEDPFVLAADTTRYVLSATRAGCTLSDSLTVNIDGIAPVVRALADTAICAVGGTAALNSQILNNCGPTALPCSGPVTTGLVGNPTGFSVSTYGPHFVFAGANYSNRKQYLYSKAELDAMGFAGGGKITAIALDYTSANEANTDISIKMGCTNLAEFDASLAFVPGLDLVFPSQSVSPNLGFTVYNLATPFAWDGKSNLIIEFCTDALQTGVGANAWSDVRYTQTGALNTCLYQNQFNVAGACSTPMAQARSIFRPNMQFTFCAAVPLGLIYSWTPALSLDNPNIPNPNATPAQTTIYSLTVSDGGSCDGGDIVTVAIDSTNFVEGKQHTITNCPAPTYQLEAQVSGAPFVPPLPSCGTNGTACTQPVYAGQVGTASTAANTFYSPFWSSTTDFRSQYIYRASDLTAAGIQSGTITAIAFNIIALNDSLPFDALTFRMGCTNDNTLSLTTGFLPSQQVLGPIVFNRVSGWNLFTLSTPFDWDGISNIVVEICNSNATTAPAATVEYTDLLGYDATMIQFTGSPGCNLTAGGGVVQQGRPNIQFSVCPPPPTPFSYNWIPSANLSNPNIANPVFTDPTPSLPDTFTVLVSGGACPVFDTMIVAPCLLPVEALELYGEQIGKAIKLDWLTRFEVNVQGFIVERSVDGQNFIEIGRKSALGNTNDESWYALLDPAPEIGANLYRVISQDFDGAVTYSNLITVQFVQESRLLDLYPNPTTELDGFYIEYFSAGHRELQVELIDLWGRTVSRNQIQLEEGFNRFLYPTEKLAAGTYFLRLRNPAHTELRKLMIAE